MAWASRNLWDSGASARRPGAAQPIQFYRVPLCILQATNHYSPPRPHRRTSLLPRQWPFRRPSRSLLTIRTILHSTRPLRHHIPMHRTRSPLRPPQTRSRPRLFHQVPLQVLAIQSRTRSSPPTYSRLLAFQTSKARSIRLLAISSTSASILMGLTAPRHPLPHSCPLRPRHTLSRRTLPRTSIQSPYLRHVFPLLRRNRSRKPRVIPSPHLLFRQPRSKIHIQNPPSTFSPPQPSSSRVRKSERASGAAVLRFSEQHQSPRGPFRRRRHRRHMLPPCTITRTVTQGAGPIRMQETARRRISQRGGNKMRTRG